MPFSTKLLNEGEDIVLDLHPHWEYFIKSGLALLAHAGPGHLRARSRNDERASSLGGRGRRSCSSRSAWVGLTYLEWVTTNFVITTDRLIYRHGVLAKHGIEIPLERVNTVFFSQTIFERMVGSGDLVIESAGEMGRQNFSNVRKPSAVQNEIYKQMEANENRKFDRINRARAGGGAASPSPTRSPSSTSSASRASSPRPSSTPRSRSCSTGCSAQRAHEVDVLGLVGVSRGAPVGQAAALPQVEADGGSARRGGLRRGS